MADVRRVMGGMRSHAVGKLFEDLIEAGCCFYRDNGIADIEKTPEPMRVLRSMGNGRFEACFAKRAQPDYKGALNDGRMIVLEAKHTDKDRLLLSAVEDHQAAQLNGLSDMNVLCFVLVSFGFEDFFRIPWDVFWNMKRVFGRKYVTAKDLAEYRIKTVRGVLMFLEGVEY